MRGYLVAVLIVCPGDCRSAVVDDPELAVSGVLKPLDCVRQSLADDVWHDGIARAEATSHDECAQYRKNDVASTLPSVSRTAWFPPLEINKYVGRHIYLFGILKVKMAI